ncbi:transcription antitermination factor NusB [Cytobacillus sp. IB215665]|uniref:transcription antitermination factor NusB n=1 Tax=Cytobacillus sp. IB215665 TaxID=3097357 RepID=UPI002A11F1D9|nr:transcription antitermination factor NusB [Cytobacillus sp. IB215665]MDX8364287.1 transcription antitermination factor NusB [Cytobacillus sp. IB215665]
MKRRTARKKALQALFQIDISDIESKEAIDNVIGEQHSDPFLEEIVLGVAKHQAEIDEHIRKNLENWTIERVANVDRSILRIAVFEMMYIDEIPTNVSIDEAIELGKLFGDEQSGKFINGVLSKISNSINRT